jgi:2-polyprenyl-3-methyl-5-hydroxy-6-metoxy-1,4-benzoquinol methylase
MDEYTKKTKIWLDERFKKCDRQGIYLAHQPIYGFQRGHCEKDPPISRYVPIYQIMKALSHLEFGSLLDVGGAEGYKAYLAREIFGVKVTNSDLSEEACKRAKEIFRVDSDPIDIHDLPYSDDQFDVVICSETLEHVTDFPKAISELLRVAAKAIIITVPHEPKEVIEENIRKKINHGHIRSFTAESLNFLKTKGYRIFSKKMLSPYTYLPILTRYLDKKLVAAFLTTFDEFASKLLPPHLGILFIVLKSRGTIHRKKNGPVSASRILNFAVPYYYIGHQNVFPCSG